MNKMAYELHLGDCIEVMRGMPDGSVDAAICDPPYGMKKAEWDNDLINPKLWLPNCRNIASRTAVFVGVRGIYDYPKPEWVISWTRSGSTQRNGKLRGFNNWEPILLYDVERLSNDVIRAPNYPDKGTEGHPTPKPLKVIKLLIERLTKPGDTIIDPFMGSGTTGVACMMEGRRFIGIEICKEYYDISEKRIYEASLQPRLIP